MTKIDTLLEQIGGLREDIGGFRSDIANLKDDRNRHERNLERYHADNQTAIGGVRNSAAAAIAELRRDMNSRFSEQAQSIAAVEQQLEEHAKKVSKMQAVRNFSRSKLAALASLGLVVLSGLALIIEAAIRWAVDRVLTWRYGG